jgi:hypothetical protein
MDTYVKGVQAGVQAVTFPSKKQAQNELTAARTRAQVASERVRAAADAIPYGLNPATALSADYDAAWLHYQRCVRELEEAINAYDVYDTGDD